MSRRARSKPSAMLLFPGAGSDRHQHTLVAIDEALSPLPVRRADFPYRKAGRKAPDRAPVLLQCVRYEAAAFCAELDIDPAQLVLGGRSMGGRICSMAVAEGLAAWGLVLISYPLHPPGKPDRLRTEHFAALGVPCLFVSADNDSFGTPSEFAAALPAIPGTVTSQFLSRGGHELKGHDDAVVAAARAFCAPGGAPRAR
jgi:predicted alpha/beta-hydrolase family hydrolase